MLTLKKLSRTASDLFKILPLLCEANKIYSYFPKCAHYTCTILLNNYK